MKLHLGAHIDGFAAITAETLVVGVTPESPVTGRRADALRAAWAAAEVAMRLVRVGNKNWQITEAVAKVAAAWDCKPVEGTFLFFFSFCGLYVFFSERWLRRKENDGAKGLIRGQACCRASRRRT